MNKSVVVIYASKYGTTKQYAEWIAEALNVEVLNKSSVKSDDLKNYDVIIYGGGLYASGIIGIDLVAKNSCQNLVIFTVGLADPETTDYTNILDKSLPTELRSKVKVFHFRGGIDYAKLGIAHRVMMAMVKKMTIEKKTVEQLTDEDRAFAETYGKKVDFTNKQSILPLINHVGQLKGNAE